MKALGRGSLSSLAVLVTIGWHLSRIVVALGLVLLVVAPFVDPPRIEIEFAVPVAFTLAPETHRVTAGTHDVARARLDDAVGMIYFSPRDLSTLIMGSLGIIAFAGVCAWILGNLKGVFETLRQGRPFVPANAVRIKRIAWGMIGFEIARALLTYVGSLDAMRDFGTQGLALHTRIDFDLFAIFTALILFVIAEVFHEGSRLDEEQSLTV